MTSAHYLDGLHYVDHHLHVPLNHQNPDEEQIQLFAREVKLSPNDNRPMLVYFQGGPGFGAHRPGSHSWLRKALEQHRVLLLDQRGTGRSTPLNSTDLSRLSLDEQLHYTSQLRADSIVKDAELWREYFKQEQWSILGQSFGGFCVLSYLSFFPQSLTKALITAGIPPITGHADRVYQHTYVEVARKNDWFFRRYPMAQQWAKEIAQILTEQPVTLPNQQIFTVEQFQQLGIFLGGKGGEARLFNLLDTALDRSQGTPRLSPAFLYEVMAALPYLTNPIYTILHEPIYNQGEASNWSAHRVREQFTQFQYQPDAAFYFTGEMVYPWMCEQYQSLKLLAPLANALAEKCDWPDLYDVQQLTQNTVPVAAVAYYNDMYVDIRLTQESVDQIPNVSLWVTNEYEHNGLSQDGGRILAELLKRAEDLRHTPSN